MVVNDATEMGRRGKIGALVRASRYSPFELTGSARAGFLKRFEPVERGLSPEEFTRRTECALRAHMAKLARLSAIARKH